MTARPNRRLAWTLRLERVAAAVRRAGFGALIDRLRGRVLARLGSFTTTVGDVRLTGNVAKHSNYVKELSGDRERHARRLFVESIATGACVVDAGAYLGWFAISAARAAGPDGRVLAYEPQPDTFEALTANLADNDVADRVIARRCALGAETGSATFHVMPEGDTSSLYATGDMPRIPVEVVRGDEEVAGRRVDVIKIDVEGAELDVLRGLDRTLTENVGHLRLFVECNPHALRNAGADPECLAAHLREKGFDVHVIDEQRGELLPFGPGVPLEPYVNLYCRAAG